jgi:hypothetical protein
LACKSEIIKVAAHETGQEWIDSAGMMFAELERLYFRPEIQDVIGFRREPPRIAVGPRKFEPKGHQGSDKSHKSDTPAKARFPWICKPGISKLVLCRLYAGPSEAIHLLSTCRCFAGSVLAIGS